MDEDDWGYSRTDLRPRVDEEKPRVTALYVDPAGLTGLEGMERRAGNDATTAMRHFDKHGEIAWVMEGLINILRDDCDRIRQDILTFLDKAGNHILPATADAVAHARDYYARTDQAAAAQMDYSMPGANVAAEARGVPGPTAGPDNRDQPSFNDVYEPTDHFGEVRYDSSSYGMDYQPKWHEMLSPTSALRTAIYKVTEFAASIGLLDRAYDPYEAILKPICGDWAGMARVGHVTNQVADCVREIGSNQSWAARCSRTAWSGNAGDAAAAHLFRVTKSLQAAAEAMDDIGAMYRSAARSAFDFADTIGGLISTIGDAAIAAAASAAIAGGAAATGVGAPVAAIAGLVGAIEVHTVVDGIITVIDLIGKFDSLTSSLKASTGHFGRIDADYPLPDLPTLPALPA
jgi:hypothetical protein